MKASIETGNLTAKPSIANGNEVLMVIDEITQLHKDEMRKPAGLSAFDGSTGRYLDYNLEFSNRRARLYQRLTDLRKQTRQEDNE